MARSQSWNCSARAEQDRPRGAQGGGWLCEFALKKHPRPEFSIMPRVIASQRAWGIAVILSAGFLFSHSTTWSAPAAVSILPGDFQLHGPSARQPLIVEAQSDGRYTGQLANALFVSSETNIVAIEGGVAVPKSNGEATIRVQDGACDAVARVKVSGIESPIRWSFRNNVQPVLAKAGCNAGACHGAAAGQNGFKLSLRGYDDEGDYLSLTHSAMGRRVVLHDPGRSLMLLKPAATVPHKGGKRFETNSLEYRILSDWIASGAPGPLEADPRIERIEVLPGQVVLKPGATQQLLVRAFFSDGHSEDVTRWAKFSESNSAVTQTDDTGNVKITGNGEGAITAWYLSKIATATVTVPYDNQTPSALFAEARRRNFIDDLVLEKLASLKLPPSARAADSEFLRRAFLDTIGMLPSAQEARDFLTDHSANKRDALIEKLLKRPEFNDYWAYKWSDLLLVNSEKLRPAAMWAYYNWIRNNVAANTPWDVLVRRIVTAKGSTLANGAANFYVLHEDPQTMSETVSQAFLGMSINCAKCHNHPMEKWTNRDYYSMANLFARVRTKSGRADGEEIVFVASSGDVNQPLTGRPQPPRPLDGKALPIASPEDRRDALAEWLVSPQNPYFSRAIVNRIWANYLGVGLVEAVDDMRKTNPASNEKLLAAAADYLAGQHFDLKALMRTILQSETYQRSSRALPENAADTRYYSHYYTRRLSAEVLLDAYSDVTGVPSEFVTDLRNQNRGLGEKYPAGFRALQLPDTKTFSYFLKTFGRPEREKTCECERSATPSMAQVLHIVNGETINKKLEAKDNAISKRLAAHQAPEELLNDVYLGSLSRPPTSLEKEKMLAALNGAPAAEKRAAIEDVYWAILSSKEFLFNH